MNAPRKPPLRHRFQAALLELDALFDSSVYELRATTARFWDFFTIFMDRFALRGWRRWGVELSSDALSLWLLGSLLVVALARPAFELAKTDWRTQQSYALTFLDRYGTKIGQRGILQSAISLDEVPQTLIMATLATEDRRFFEHFGIDMIGTLRAIISNARSQGSIQGGSSITQQLAKNLFLSSERSLERKIKEAFLALWLEANFSKRDILELYFARAYMGGGTFGVEAASQFYFGKSVRGLNLSEAAMLSGLYKAPSKYAPHTNLPAARGRAQQVLSNLVDAGFMREGQVHGARMAPATPVARHTQESPDYFLDWVYEEAKKKLPAHVRSAVVRTTVDLALQEKAQTTLESALRQHEESYEVEQAAMVVMEPDGAVRALIGGRDYGASQFNRATHALRQPGSSFKPFVYLTAFLNGYTPDSIVPDAPLTMGNWSPQNYNRSYAGAVSLTTALARSINTVPVRLANAVSRAKIITTAKMLGISTPLAPSSPLPLGVDEVTVFDMARAYAVFASGGRQVTGYGILDMRDEQGKLIYAQDQDETAAPQIFPLETISALNGALHQVVEAGTGGRAKIEGLVTAGKTGTTQDYRDAWFIGFTGNYVASVWFGNDDFSAMERMTGGTVPASVWADFMRFAHNGVELKPVPGIGQMPVAQASSPMAEPSTPVRVARTIGLSAKSRALLLRLAEELDAGSPHNMVRP